MKKSQINNTESSKVNKMIISDNITINYFTIKKNGILANFTINISSDYGIISCNGFKLCESKDGESIFISKPSYKYNDKYNDYTLITKKLNDTIIKAFSKEEPKLF